MALDEIELQKLLVNHADRLRHHVARKIPPELKSVISAEDIVQEACVAAFRGLPSFRQDRPDAFERWMATLVERKLVDACKAARTLKRGGSSRPLRGARSWLTTLADLFDRVGSGERTPSREMSAKEVGTALREAMDDLPEDRRQAVWMRHIEGRPLTEIADTMQKSTSAVNSLLFHGLRQLRQHLGRAARFFSDAPR